MTHAGALVMVNIAGTVLDATQAAFLRDHRIRGVCVFRGNLGTETEVRQLTRDLRQTMGEHALIGLDQEGGSVVRATSLPQVLPATARSEASWRKALACSNRSVATACATTRST